MRHLSEQQLVLHYYGESRAPAAIEEHLAACEKCRAAWNELAGVMGELDAPAPERGEEYGHQVWQRIRPRLDAAGPAPQPWRRWAFVAAMATLIVAAFLTGRFWPARPAPLAPQVRERILLVAVGQHLERSEMVLVELLNAPSNGGADISSEQQRAEDLLASSRLYRVASARAGQAGLSSVLEDVERLLIEIVHSPSRLPRTELEEFRQRIEDGGLLFRVRVVGAGLRSAGRAPRGSS